MEYSGIDKWRNQGKCAAVIENFVEDPVNNFSFNTYSAETLALIVSGVGFMAEYSKYHETMDGDDYDNYWLSSEGGNTSDTSIVCWISTSDSGYSGLKSIYEKGQKSTYEGNEVATLVN